MYRSGVMSAGTHRVVVPVGPSSGTETAEDGTAADADADADRTAAALAVGTLGKDLPCPHLAQQSSDSVAAALPGRMSEEDKPLGSIQLRPVLLHGLPLCGSQQELPGWSSCSSLRCSVCGSSSVSIDSGRS